MTTHIEKASLSPWTPNAKDVGQSSVVATWVRRLIQATAPLHSNAVDNRETGGNSISRPVTFGPRSDFRQRGGSGLLP
jgi:hypothetical protein